MNRWPPELRQSATVVVFGFAHRFMRRLVKNTALRHVAPMVGRAAFGTAIALLFAVAAQRWGERPVRWLLPAMQTQLHDLLPEFRISIFAVAERAGQAQLGVQALLARPLQIGHHVVDQIVLADAAVTLGAFWQPVAVAMATAAVWPPTVRGKFGIGKNWSRNSAGSFRPATLLAARALALCSSCLGATALSVFLAPSVLAGMIIGDIYWHEASEQIIPHIARLPRFLEEGGWLMLGLTTGSLCAIAAQWMLTWRSQG